MKTQIRAGVVAVLTAALLFAAVGTSQAADVIQSGTVACAGKYGWADGQAMGAWSNVPPGHPSSSPYSGTSSGSSSVSIYRTASVAGGGAYKMTASVMLAVPNPAAGCSAAG